MGISSKMQRYEKCLAANQLHDAAKRLHIFAANRLHYEATRLVAKRLCSKTTGGHRDRSVPNKN